MSVAVDFHFSPTRIDTRVGGVVHAHIHTIIMSDFAQTGLELKASLPIKSATSHRGLSSSNGSGTRVNLVPGMN